MPIRQRHPLDQSSLYKLRSRSKLARLLGVTLAQLSALAMGDCLYTEFDIPKKYSLGSRHVENPQRPLKLVQARLARLLARIEPPDFLFCPVKGRCYVSNAAAHRNNRMIQCLDIKAFFPSTPQRRVFWFYHQIMKCERDIAGLLAKLACFQGHLPTGSPLSPIIAYFAYYDLWESIDQFCKKRGFTFTVYVDDVTISGAKVPRSAIWEVRQMIRKAGLHYHKEKTFVDGAAEITGVIVGDGQLCAPFRQHKKMREARLLLSSAVEEDRAAHTARMAGIRGQIKQIASKNQ